MRKNIISRYNPATESPEVIKGLFSGRDKNLLTDEILNELRNLKPDKLLQPRLIYGPQGIGKTHFLWNLFYSIKDDPELSEKYLPIILPEENFGANCAADLLISALKEISQKSKRTNADDTSALLVKERLITIEKIKEKDEKFNKCRSVLKEIFEQGKVVVLMIENLDRIFDSFPESEIKHFSALIARTNFLLIIGSAVTIFEDISNTKGSLYGYLKLHRMETLDNAEVDDLLSRIMRVYRKEHEKFIEYLESQAGEKKKRLIQAIVYLSGGIPRMIYPLYEISLAECAADDLKENTEIREHSLTLLSRIFEELTAVYKEILWNLPVNERRVLEIIGLADFALQPKDIAREAEIPLNKLSVILNRLREKRFIRYATITSGKEQFYCPSEPLLGLWLKWRKGAGEEEKWLFIGDLLAILFSREELQKKRDRLEDGDIFSKPYEEAFRKCEFYNEKFFTKISHSDNKPMQIDKADRKVKKYKKDAQLDPVEWFNKGVELAELKRFEEALAAYEEAIKLEPKDLVAWNNKGAALAELKRFEEALVAYEEAIKLQPEYFVAWNNKGATLAELKRFEEALVAYEEAIKLEPKDFVAWYNKGNTLAKLKRFEEALVAYEEAIKFEPKNFNVWNNKGNVLGTLRQFEKAIKAYEGAIKLNSKATSAWYNKGVALTKLNRFEEALEAYEEAIKLTPSFCYPLILNSLSDENMRRVVKLAEANPKKFVYQFVISLSLYLKEDTKEKGVELLQKIDLPDNRFLQNIIEPFSLLCDYLLSEKRFNEVEILFEIIKKIEEGKSIPKISYLGEEWKYISDMLSPYHTIINVFKDITDNPLKALRRVERLEASQRLFVIRFIDSILGKDWLREAQKRLEKKHTT